MRKLRTFFLILAALFSHGMCAMVAYNYAQLQCGIEHRGFSAPASAAFFYCIPFGIAIVTSLVMAWGCTRSIK